MIRVASSGAANRRPVKRDLPSQSLRLPGRVTAISLELPEGMPFERWQAIGETLRDVERSVMWWIGDWLRYGEKRYGETYKQAMAATGAAYQTLINAQNVAEKIESNRRRVNLTWSHHAEVAALPAAQANALLDQAEHEGWTRNDLRAAVNRIKNAPPALVEGDTCTVDDLNKLIAAGRTFGTIYADPPWRYDNQGTRAATRNHYQEGEENPPDGMTVEQICALPIDKLAATDAHLHMWTTNAFLFECPRIFDAWGFEFRSSFVWTKSSMGIGNYWRNAHEILLTAVRGDAMRFNDHSLISWIEVDRGRHSGKPEQVRAMLEKASGGPRLELFARSPATGWHSWGNQIERGLLHQHVKEFAA